MDLPPFLLNQWLESYLDVPYNLAGSTGPRWTLSELLALGEGEPDLGALALGYAPPRGRAELRNEIARYHQVDPDWVLVTNGASEAFLLVLVALARTDGNLVLPFPGYPAFAGVSAAMGLRQRHYRLDRERGYRLDPAEVTSRGDEDTVLAVANSPHNPTGSLVPRGECAALARALGDLGVPLLMDEVFHPIYFAEPNPTSAGIDNVIVVGDMSKALSMPGLRIGWVIDRDAERRARMVNARSYLSLGSSPILEALALRALRSREVILQRTRSVAATNLAALTRFMEQMGAILDWVPPQAGLLAFPWFRDGRDSRAFCERMVSSGVFVSPGDCFGEIEHFHCGLFPTLFVMRGLYIP